MNKLFSLIKLQIKNFFSYANKKSQNLIYAIAVLAITICFVSYSYAVSTELIVLGMAYDVSAVMLLVSCLIIFVMTVFKGCEILFKSNDTELLLSLPIKTSVIVNSRLVFSYLLSFSITLVTMVPALVSLMINSTIVTPLFLIVYVLLMMFVPLIPMVLAFAILIVNYLISLKSKFNSLVYLALNLLCIGLILTFLFYNIKNSSYSLSKIVFAFYPISRFFQEALFESNLFCFMIFVFISILVYSLFVIILSDKYKSIYCKFCRSSTYDNKKAVLESTGFSPLKAFYKKELKRYFTLPVYVFNSLSVLVMLVIGSILLLFVDFESLEMFLKSSGLEGMIGIFPPLAESAVISTCLISCVSLSLEGKCKWIVDTLAVEKKVIYLAKLLVHLTITILAVLISSLCICIFFRMDLLGIFVQFLFPLSVAIFSAVIGLFINIKIPNYNWKSETQVVKQSGSAFFSLFVSIFSVAVAYVVLLLTSNNLWSLVGYSLAIFSVSYFVWSSVCRESIQKKYKSLT